MLLITKEFGFLLTVYFMCFIADRSNKYSYGRDGEVDLASLTTLIYFSPRVFSFRFRVFVVSKWWNVS